jgi:putative transcriptional regulator
MKSVKELRQKMLLTQYEFAHLLGVSRTSIASYESGFTMPSFKMIRKLIDLGKQNDVKIDANDFFVQE